MTSTDMDPEILATFLDESGQCLATLNDKLLLIENGSETTGVIDEMFRAAHSMKGSAGFLNLTAVTGLTHSLETVLDWIRKDKLAFNPAVVDALFQAFDIISALLADIAAGTIGEVDISPFVDQLEALLDREEEVTEDGNPEFELGAMPEWLADKLELDDVLEALMARNAGKRLFALLLSLREIFESECDPLELHHSIESVVQIQEVIPLPQGDMTPWQPLESYDLKIGLFCFCEEEIAISLNTIKMPTCDIWEIIADKPLQAPVRYDKAAISIEEKTTILAIKEDMAKHKATWLSETCEELEQLDMALVAYEETPADRNHLNQLFRLMHRIKGSSATMGLQELTRIAHNCESLLANIRETSDLPTPEMLQVFFDVKDYLDDCVRRVESNNLESPDSTILDQRLVELLTHQEESPLSRWQLADEQIQAVDEAIASGQTVWKALLQLEEGTPLPDLRYAMMLRSFEGFSAVLSSVPNLHDLEVGIDQPPALRILFATDLSEVDLKRALQFDMLESYLLEQVSGVLKGSESAIGTVVVSETQSDRAGAAPMTGQPGQQSMDTIRVDTTRLDHLMNVAGELVITKARVTQLTDAMNREVSTIDIGALESLLWMVRQAGDKAGVRDDISFSNDKLRKLEGMLDGLRSAQETASQLRDTSIELHRHTSSVQNGVMQIRMVPIGPLFKRFHRLIRDLCKESDTDSKLVLAGESTELDKKLIDELTDPLTHLIRNSVDHGLEGVVEREAAGKPGQGTVRLEAFHEGGQICVRVSDDGRGLNIEKIKEKAIKNGIVTREGAEHLTEDEINHLIFQPGFSTAAQVTNISGRGVGMDIVRSKVNELKGKIDIETALGKGTSFTIRLPLTLAMIEALLVQIGNTRYAFPLEVVREIVEVGTEQLKSVEGKGQLIFLREEAISLVNLSKVMDADPLISPNGSVRAVITKSSGENLAVAVDRVIGEEEIVVKALSEEFSTVRGVSGATVLGDGGIALILDVTGICELSKDGTCFDRC
ncbi:hypothetical protein BVY04_03305 [bacterium M21]|nr:hypothetical protein BVY04_03305 [bacterium M21]